jgi:hypothetical protein
MALAGAMALALAWALAEAMALAGAMAMALAMALALAGAMALALAGAMAGAMELETQTEYPVTDGDVEKETEVVIATTQDLALDMVLEEEISMAITILNCGK